MMKDCVTTDAIGRCQVLHTNDDVRTNIVISVIYRMSSELPRRFAEDACSIYHGISALHTGSKQFLDRNRISTMATHHQANLPDLSADIHTVRRLLQRKNIDAVGGDTEPAAMDSTLRF